MITTEQIKGLRDRTGISVMQCKKALEDSGGDVEKALVLLAKKGADVAAKKADRALGSGAIGSYVHSNGRIGAMVTLLCETDFVSNNEEFKALARDLAMHIAATSPEYVKAADIPAEVKEAAAQAFVPEVKNKPKDLQAKIIEGKVAAFFAEKTLLEQPFVKDSERLVKSLIEAAIQKFGENIEIGKFVRLSA